MLDAGDGELWIAQPQLLRHVEARPGGVLRVTETVALPAGVVPVDVKDGDDYFFVLDAAGGQLLAYRSTGPAGQPQRLAVGTESGGDMDRLRGLPRGLVDGIRRRGQLWDR